MKSKLFLTAILTCFLAFTSCSDDDSEVSSELLGEWLVEGIDHEQTGYESLEGEEFYFIFKEGGKFTSTSPEGSDNGTYTVDGKSLKITFDGDTEEFSIDKLTSDELEITGAQKIEFEDGTSQTFIITFYLTR